MRNNARLSNLFILIFQFAFLATVLLLVSFPVQARQDSFFGSDNPICSELFSTVQSKLPSRFFEVSLLAQKTGPHMPAARQTGLAVSTDNIIVQETLTHPDGTTEFNYYHSDRNQLEEQKTQWIYRSTQQATHLFISLFKDTPMLSFKETGIAYFNGKIVEIPELAGISATFIDLHDARNWYAVRTNSNGGKFLDYSDLSGSDYNHLRVAWVSDSLESTKALPEAFRGKKVFSDLHLLLSDGQQSILFLENSQWKQYSFAQGNRKALQKDLNVPAEFQFSSQLAPNTFLFSKTNPKTGSTELGISYPDGSFLQVSTEMKITNIVRARQNGLLGFLTTNGMVFEKVEDFLGSMAQHRFEVRFMDSDIEYIFETLGRIFAVKKDGSVIEYRKH